MTTSAKKSPKSKTSNKVQDPKAVTKEVLAWLERRGSKKNRDGMARYAIVAPKVFGVSV